MPSSVTSTQPGMRGHAESLGHSFLDFPSRAGLEYPEQHPAMARHQGRQNPREECRREEEREEPKQQRRGRAGGEGVRGEKAGRFKHGREAQRVTVQFSSIKERKIPSAYFCPFKIKEAPHSQRKRAASYCSRLRVARQSLSPPWAQPTQGL